MDECRYQVLFTLKGIENPELKQGVRNFTRKKDAKAFEKSLKELGYKDVRFWDTLDNSLTGLMKF